MLKLDILRTYNASSGRRYALAVGGISLAAIFAYYFTLNHTLREVDFPNAPEYSFPAAFAGTAATPFRYRVLVIWIINGLLRVLPRSAGVSSPWEVMVPIETATMLALLVVLWCWLGAWSEQIYPKSIGMVLSVNALIITYLGSTKLSHFYWYDIPSVLFFTAGLLAIKRNRLTLFYPLFVLATLNKETSCFLSVAFLALRWQRGRRAAASHVAAQAVLWFGIKAILSYGAGQGAASTFWWALPRNVQALGSLKEYDVLLLLSTLGFLPVVTLALWRFVEDRDARRLALVALPFVGGMFLVGWVEEVRIYGELLPVLLPASVLGINGLVFGTSHPDLCRAT